MKDLKKNIKFAWKYTKGQRKNLFFLIICNIISIIISVIIPIISAKIIIELTQNMLYQVIITALVIYFIETLRNFIHYFHRNLSSTIYRETFKKIQIALGREILRLENKCLDETSSGIFIQRLTNDTSRIADVFTSLNINITNIVTNIGIFAALFIINKKAFLLILIMIIIMYFIEQKRVTIRNIKDKDFRKSNEQVSGFVSELVRGCRDIKMLSAEESFMKELETKIVNLNDKRYKMVRTDTKYNLAEGSLVDLFDTLLIILLVYLISTNQLEIPNALVIYNYMGRVISIVNYFSTLFEKVKDFNLSSERIFAVLKSDEFPKEKFGSKHLSKVEGNFEFKNVTFSYKDTPVLKNVSFKVKANETVAFVGKSGAGKSTIFNLLCKMYDINVGTITIDGEDINTLDKASIRDNITIISQNPYIFNMSIRDNLRLVKEDLTDEEMVEACRLSSLDTFINSLPDKYDTIVGEGGISLSGGERQRLAIARALVQKTEIILFDEATSSLDNETQLHIQKAIDNLKKDYTILIIAHRLSTIINSDRILFLNNGQIEASGPHKELLEKNKNYRNLYESESFDK